MVLIVALVMILVATSDMVLGIVSGMTLIVELGSHGYDLLKLSISCLDNYI